MKNKKTYKLHCPYCGAPAACRPASTVYGTETLNRKGYLYVCSNWPACDAYVYAHKADRRPMGTLANSELRHKRILAHHALERLQKERHMDKWAAYVWLQAKFGLDREHAHIGMFTEQMCDQLISQCIPPQNHSHRQNMNPRQNCRHNQNNSWQEYCPGQCHGTRRRHNAHEKPYRRLAA